MCVIAYSAKGKEAPTEETLKKMWETNPDGAGFAYIGKNGNVVYKKGFMTFESLMKELKPLDRFTNTDFAIHFRIGTSGKNDAGTCHPFPIETEYGALRKTEGEVDAVLFHNGILGQGGQINSLSSDTQDFVSATAPLFKKYFKSKARDAFINDCITGSKLLVMYKNNRIKLYGKWETDGDLFVSNLNYKYRYDYYGQAKIWTPEDGWYDDWDDEYGWETYRLPAKTNTKQIQLETKMSDGEAAHVETLWADLIRDFYIYATPHEFSLMKRTADDWDEKTLYRDDYIFEYEYEATGNEERVLIWIDETPEDRKNEYAEYEKDLEKICA